MDTLANVDSQCYASLCAHAQNFFHSNVLWQSTTSQHPGVETGFCI